MLITHTYFIIPTTLLVLLISVLPTLGFYLVRKIHAQRQKVSKLYACTGCVPATVIQVGLEDQSWREGWVVKAIWKDEKTGQAFLFSSSPQKLLPRQRMGDNVLVFIHSNDPISYTIEL